MSLAIIADNVALEPNVLDWAAVGIPSHMAGEEHLRAWLAQGFNADMQWMNTHIEVRLHPERLLDGVQSALVFLWKYPQKLRPENDPSELRIAAYAQGEDYHITLGKWLNGLVAKLQDAYPEAGFRPFVDALPVLERELAVLGGLGWIGRNSMLIHPRHGSSFFIGGILTTKSWGKVGGHESRKDFCGTCTRCITACPTGAIRAERQVDARSCISYLTIEKSGAFSAQESSGLGNWLFGCDLCQSCCPWNSKHLGADDPFWPNTREQWRHLLVAGNGLRSRIRGTPLLRTGRKGLLRNFTSLDSSSKK